MFTPKSWIILTKDIVNLWQKYSDSLDALEVSKLTEGASNSYQEWLKMQRALKGQFSQEVDILTEEHRKQVREAVVEAVTKAIEVADLETLESLPKGSTYSTPKRIVATQINKVLAEQNRIINATVRQFKANDNNTVSLIAVDVKRQIKHTASHKGILDDAGIRLLNNQKTFEVIKRYTMDEAFRAQSVTYDSGRRVSLKSYVEMNIRTNVQKVALDTMNDACGNLGFDLFLASEHADCADDHKDYQGKVYTTNAKKYDGKYPSKQDAEANGFCTRPNCRHYFMPITEEQAINLDKTKSQLHTKKGAYNPKNYEDLKEQRAYERRIRSFKKKASNCEKLIANAPKEEVAKLTQEMSKYNAKVKFYQKKQRALMASNHYLTRDYQRENATKLTYDLGVRVETK